MFTALKNHKYKKSVTVLAPIVVLVLNTHGMFLSNKMISIADSSCRKISEYSHRPIGRS